MIIVVDEVEIERINNGKNTSIILENDKPKVYNLSNKSL